MRDEATLRVFRMRWWTPDPHPCLGGCGTILQYPGAKRCSKCNRAHVREKEKVRYRERREREGFVSSAGKSRLSRGEGSARSIGSDIWNPSGSRRRRSDGGIGSSSIARSVESRSRRSRKPSTVVPARSIGTEHGISDDVLLGSRKEDFARTAGGFQQRRIGSIAKSAR